jgi:hypothetical protein
MLKNSEIKKLYKLHNKNKNKKSQNEIDLINIEKIKSCAVNGKIAIIVNNGYFYDSFEYAVDGYNSENVYLINANYTSLRHFLNETEKGADCPYSVEIKKPTEFFELKHI